MLQVTAALTLREWYVGFPSIIEIYSGTERQ